jgi:hypothetical protein
MLGKGCPANTKAARPPPPLTLPGCGAALLQEGFLEKDPRSTGFQWRELLAPVVGDLRLESDVSQVAEVGGCPVGPGVLADTADMQLQLPLCTCTAAGHDARRGA